MVTSKLSEAKTGQAHAIAIKQNEEYGQSVVVTEKIKTSTF